LATSLKRGSGSYFGKAETHITQHADVSDGSMLTRESVHHVDRATLQPWTDEKYWKPRATPCKEECKTVSTQYDEKERYHKYSFTEKNNQLHP